MKVSKGVGVTVAGSSGVGAAWVGSDVAVSLGVCIGAVVKAGALVMLSVGSGGVFCSRQLARSRTHIVINIGFNVLLIDFIIIV